MPRNILAPSQGLRSLLARRVAHKLDAKLRAKFHCTATVFSYGLFRNTEEDSTRCRRHLDAFERRVEVYLTTPGARVKATKLGVFVNVYATTPPTQH